MCYCWKLTQHATVGGMLTTTAWSIWVDDMGNEFVVSRYVTLHTGEPAPRSRPPGSPGTTTWVLTNPVQYVHELLEEWARQRDE